MMLSGTGCSPSSAPRLLNQRRRPSDDTRPRDIPSLGYSRLAFNTGAASGEHLALGTRSRQIRADAVSLRLVVDAAKLVRALAVNEALVEPRSGTPGQDLPRVHQYGCRAHASVVAVRVGSAKRPVAHGVGLAAQAKLALLAIVVGNAARHARAIAKAQNDARLAGVRRGAVDVGLARPHVRGVQLTLPGQRLQERTRQGSRPVAGPVRAKLDACFLSLDLHRTWIIAALDGERRATGGEEPGEEDEKERYGSQGGVSHRRSLRQASTLVSLNSWGSRSNGALLHVDPRGVDLHAPGWPAPAPRTARGRDRTGGPGS